MFRQSQGRSTRGTLPPRDQEQQTEIGEPSPQQLPYLKWILEGLSLESDPAGKQAFAAPFSAPISNLKARRNTTLPGGRTGNVRHCRYYERNTHTSRGMFVLRTATDHHLPKRPGRC